MNESAIFTAASKLPREQRPSFVKAACGENLELAHEVEALLNEQDDLGGFIDQPAIANCATALPPPPLDHAGTLIGPYKLLEQIGEGGMGVVFVAEQKVPVERRVALKIIKPGMDSRQVLARFEAERQALALMDHPNIAKVLDAGEVTSASGWWLEGERKPTPALATSTSHASGRPYFVMELVRGVPITQYCDEHHLTPRQRLELLLPVCQAIQHAHQKGIIHRDIKPTNILVAEYDQKAVPKVIDFGVAKATSQALTEKTMFTGFGQIVGTLEYMSPEQAKVNQLDIDTRSDIYSLGVLMYELLTCSTPFDKQRLRSAAWDEMLRIIREEEPEKPSTRLSSVGSAHDRSAGAAAVGTAHPTLASIAAVRGTEPARLTKLVRGELDWIVMKALEKDRNRRYETANGFAADIERYLNDEPVVACPPSAGYRLRKFARRNQAALMMASVIGVAILFAAGSFGWVVRDREAGRVRTAGEVNQFLQRAETLYADNKLPEAVAEVQKARGVLEAGSGGADLEQRVRQWLTDLDTAAKLEEIHHESLPHRDRMYADYARVFRDYGIDVEALPGEEATAQIAASQIKIDLALALNLWASRLRSDPRPQDPARWQRLLAISRGAYADPWRLRLLDAAEAKDVQALRELANGADPARLSTRTLGYLGQALKTAGDPEAALAFLRKAQRQHPGDFSINSTLADRLSELKPQPWDEVIAFRRAALAVRPQTAWVHSNLGKALIDQNKGKAVLDQNKVDEAIACYRTAIELDPKYGTAHNNLGVALRHQNKLDEAIACYRKAIELDPRSAAHYNLGWTLANQGKLDEAVVWLKKATELDPASAGAYSDLGGVLSTQKKFPEAGAAFRTAIALDPRSAFAYTGLGDILRQQKKLDDAIAAYRTATEIDEKSLAALINLGSALFSQNKLGEAIACYRKVIQLDPKQAEAYFFLGVALQRQQKLDEAIDNFRVAIQLRPEIVAFYDNLAVVLKTQGKADRALEVYHGLIRANPTSAEGYHKLGAALKEQGQLAEAIEAYSKAIELNPKFSWTHSFLGDALRAKGDLEGAIAAYRKAIELDPKRAQFYKHLGNALDDKGLRDEAAAALDEHERLALAPLREAYRLKQNDAARNALAWVLNNLAWELVTRPKTASRDSGRAVSLAREAVELKPREGSFFNTLGVALYRGANWNEAIKTLEKADQLTGGKHYSFNAFFIGMAYWQMGSQDEARKWYERAVEWMDKNQPKNEDLRRFRAEAAEVMNVERKEV